MRASRPLPAVARSSKNDTPKASENSTQSERAQELARDARRKPSLSRRCSASRAT
jgi:hypothetical protein